MRLLFGLTIAYIALGATAVNPLGGGGTSETKVLGLVGSSAAPPSIKNVQQMDNNNQHAGVQYSSSNPKTADPGLVGALMKRRLIRRQQQASGPPKGSVLAAVSELKALNVDMSPKGSADPAKSKGGSSGSDELLGKKAVDVVTPGANDGKKKAGAPDPLVNVAPGDHAIIKATAPAIDQGPLTTGDQQPPKQA